VVGSCEHGDEPSDSGATELVIHVDDVSGVHNMELAFAAGRSTVAPKTGSVQIN
jgi:hypothetical protein